MRVVPQSDRGNEGAKAISSSLSHRSVLSGIVHPHIQVRDLGPARIVRLYVVRVILISRLRVFGLRLGSSNFTPGAELVFSASSRERGRRPRRKRRKCVLCVISKHF